MNPPPIPTSEPANPAIVPMVNACIFSLLGTWEGSFTFVVLLVLVLVLVLVFVLVLVLALVPEACSDVFGLEVDRDLNLC